MIIAPLAVLLTIFVGIIVFFCRRNSKYAQSQITEVTRAYDVDSIGTFSDLKGDFSGKEKKFKFLKKNLKFKINIFF